jgi:dihydroorotate dehydrogenase electron transfer subunit
LELIGRRPIHYATNDGSTGFQGLVTDLFEQMVVPDDRILVMTCGPKKMMSRVVEICQEKKLDCWVSLERTMACGLGVCYGCSIETNSGLMKRICCEGPVFSATEVSNELQT